MAGNFLRKLIPQIFFWENIFARSQGASALRDMLRKNILFYDLSARELRYLERIVHIRHYAAGETVFEQGERALGMYIITAGRINVVVRSLSADTLQSKETLIVALTEGAFFGEHSLIETDAKRTASTVAAENTTLIAFMKPDLLEIVQRRPLMGLKITMQLAKVLSARLRKTTEKLTELSQDFEGKEAMINGGPNGA